eukprot:4701763-Ditylum_brightwellii.AAC.1
MLKTFTLEIFHLIQANVAFTECNARACYDRIIAIITGLAQYKAGMPLKVCQFFIKALKQMQYQMMTAYGTLSATNRHSPSSPVHGSGQGSTSLSAEWTFNADIILKCYSDQANGCVIKDPTNGIIQERDADMIVNDVTMQHNVGQYHLDA